MRSETAVRWSLSGALVVAALRLLPLSAQTPSGTVEFVAHTIGTDLRGGYQVVIADLNKDGKPDIIALASNVPELVWYENPGWQRHVIIGGMQGLINVSANDIDGDGIPELALAQGFTMSPKTSAGVVLLLTHGADPTAPWTPKEIDRVPTAHRLRWIDADGSGRKMLVMAPLVGPDAVAPDYKSPVSINFYRAPDWKREVVTDAFTGLIHGIEPMPWPGVKGEALLSASFMGVYLHTFANGKWTSAELLKGSTEPWPKSGASDIALGRLGAQRFIATIEPWHGNQIVIYKDNKTSWQRQVIDDTLTDGHAVLAADVDNDGRDEVVAGQRGGERSLIMYGASRLARRGRGASWTRAGWRAPAAQRRT